MGILPSFQHSNSVFVEKYIDLSVEQYERLSIYADFLVEYNEKVNLTAITSGEDILIKHFLDSILLTKFYNIPKNATLIDVGTGAGFPSIPLKIFRSDIKVTLLDSLNKRIIFLTELCRRLEIECEFVHSRAELLAREQKYRDQYDIATARAVAVLPTLTEYCLPFVKKSGVFIAMRGSKDEGKDAQNAIKILGGKIKSENNYSLSNGDGRKIIVIEKISPTPAKYPRNSGQIKAKAL